MRLTEKEKRNFSEDDVTVSVNAEIIKTRWQEVSKRRPASLYFSCDDYGRLYSVMELKPNSVRVDFKVNVLGSLTCRVEVLLPSFEAQHQRRLQKLITQSVRLAFKK